VSGFESDAHPLIQVDVGKSSARFSVRAGSSPVKNARGEIFAFVPPQDFTLSGQIVAAAGGWDHVSLRLDVEDLSAYGRRFSMSLAEYPCGTDWETKSFRQTIRFCGNRPTRPVKVSLKVTSNLWGESVELRHLSIELRDALGAGLEGVDTALQGLESQDPVVREQALAFLRKRGEAAADALRTVGRAGDAEFRARVEEVLRSIEADRQGRVFVDLPGSS
jgi:hypothetical protein